MLVTTCTHCQSRFRVTPQQLNEKQGQVRCGRCQRIFNGFEALERFPDDDTGSRLLAQREAEERASGTVPDVQPAPEEELPEIESVGTAPPIPVPIPPVAVPDAPAAERPPAEAPRRSRPPRSAPVASAAAPAPADLTLEPPPRKPVPRAWAFGVALLTVVLAVEAAFAFRAPLAQRYPATRFALEAACGPLRCTVPWSRQDALLKLEESDMLEVPGKPNEIALGARIRNLATVAQEYPHLELTLTDFTGQPAARRVLRPTDYLGRAVLPGEVLAPGSEIAIQIRLETPRIKPTGYELLLFYP